LVVGGFVGGWRKLELEVGGWRLWLEAGGWRLSYQLSAIIVIAAAQLWWCQAWLRPLF
jgi:hypothetical protein